MAAHRAIARSAKPLTLAELAKRINQEHAAVLRVFKTTVGHVQKAGIYLIRAREKISHGGWETWVQENTDVSPRTARAYMQIAREFSELDDTKRQHAADLSQRRFLEALTQPPTTDETVDTTAEEEALDEPTYVQPIGPREITVHIDPPVAVKSLHPKPSYFPPTLSDEERAESWQKLGWGEVMSGVNMLILAAKHHDPGELVQGVKLEELASHHERIERASEFLDRVEALMAEKLKSSSTLH